MSDENKSTAAADEEKKAEEAKKAEEEKTASEAKENEELGEAGKKALDAERKARRDAEKSAKDLAAKLKEFEDKDKSETDKLREAAETAQKDLTEANRKYLQLKVGSAKGLAPEIASRLQGEDEDAMNEDADRLLEVLGKPAKPTGSADEGVRGKTPDASQDMNSLLRKAAKGS